MRKAPFIIAVCFVVLVIACSKSGDDTMRRAARILFEKQSELINAYTDSLENLPDTVDREPVLSRFRDKLTALNLRYPHDADAAMTEGENDTLYNLTRRLLQAAVPKEKSDSVPADSVSSAPAVAVKSASPSKAVKPSVPTTIKQ